MVSGAPDPSAPLFDTRGYAANLPQRLKRALELGPKYYLWDLPRYTRQRRRLGLSPLDVRTLWNPLRSFRTEPYVTPEPPPFLDQAMAEMDAAGVKFDNTRLRVEALVGRWWQTRDIAGDVIECGAYHGSLSLLLAVLGRLNSVDKQVLVLDTFEGMPEPSDCDDARAAGEYAPGANWEDTLSKQANALDVGERLEIHKGLFSDTFARWQGVERRFSFVHIDANIYQSTLDACEYTIPRITPGGIVVFDDYNGVCDLGARLAIDKFLGPHSPRPEPLAECSAYLRR